MTIEFLRLQLFNVSGVQCVCFLKFNKAMHIAVKRLKNILIRFEN